MAGSFALADAGLDSVSGAAGGVDGITVGWLVAEIRKRITDNQLHVAISLRTGNAACILASH